MIASRKVLRQDRKGVRVPCDHMFVFCGIVVMGGLLFGTFCYIRVALQVIHHAKEPPTYFSRDKFMNEHRPLSVKSFLEHDKIRGSMKNSNNSVLKEVPYDYVTPLREIDYNNYTVRINTYRRNEQLLISLNHWSKCEGVLQIQVVWCDEENSPPEEIENHSSGKVVIERHSINSLNERFHITTPEEPLLTMGILSVDDDVLRPCEAVDEGFFRWTRNPHRMVGYDTRVHVVSPDGTWQYGALSISQKTHTYSMALTRFAFIHRDYMKFYYDNLPASILDIVTENLNCEDIAMTLLISLFTNGQPPLLANMWARKTQIKLYQDNAISGGDDPQKQEEHRQLRNQCMDDFALLFGFKSTTQPLNSNNWKEWDDTMKPYFSDEHSMDTKDMICERERKLVKLWQDTPNKSGLVNKWTEDASSEARTQGFIQKTKEWVNKFKPEGQ